MLRLLTFLAAVAALTGCVSSGAHDALRRQCAETEQKLKADMGACEGRVRDQEGALTAERVRAADLDEALAAEKTRVVEAEQRIAALKEQLVAARTDLDAAAKKRIAELEGALVKARVRGDELQAALDAEKARTAELTGRVAALDGQIAAAARKAAEARKSHETAMQALQAKVADLVKDRAQLEGSVQDMQLALADLERRRRQADARVAEFKQLLERFRPLIDTGRLRVKIADGRMVVELATDVLFASGSAKLSAEGKKAVREVAAVLASVPERGFQVEGHTDNLPIHTKRYRSNWELAAARAIRVVQAMVAAGLQPERVSAASYAEFKPAAKNKTAAGRKTNRRIEIVVVPDLSSLPGFEELKQAATK